MCALTVEFLAERENVFPRREPRVGSVLEVASIPKPLLSPRQSALQVSGCLPPWRRQQLAAEPTRLLSASGDGFSGVAAGLPGVVAVITGSRSLSAGIEGKRR